MTMNFVSDQDRYGNHVLQSDRSMTTSDRGMPDTALPRATSEGLVAGIRLGTNPGAGAAGVGAGAGTGTGVGVGVGRSMPSGSGSAACTGSTVEVQLPVRGVSPLAQRMESSGSAMGCSDASAQPRMLAAAHHVAMASASRLTAVTAGLVNPHSSRAQEGGGEHPCGRHGNPFTG